MIRWGGDLSKEEHTSQLETDTDGLDDACFLTGGTRIAARWWDNDEFYIYDRDSGRQVRSYDVLLPGDSGVSSCPTGQGFVASDDDVVVHVVDAFKDTYTSRGKDGWVCTTHENKPDSKDRVMWLPPSIPSFTHRDTVTFKSTLNPQPRVDLRDAVLGLDWADCYQGDTLSTRK